MSEPGINLKELMDEHANAAEFWWGISTLGRIGLVVITVLALIVNLDALLPLLAFLLAILIGVAQWKTERLRSLSGRIQRKFELYDGLGIPVTANDISDMVLSVNAESRTRLINAGNTPTDYFDSSQTKSPRRLLENLEESSWWSKHEAHKMALYVAVFNVITVLIALIVFYISLQSAFDQTTQSNISKVVTSLITVLVSGGYIKMAFDYEIFARNAANAEAASIQMQSQETPDAIQSIKLLQDYQIARAGAPLLPNLLYRSMEKGLNETWKSIRRKARETTHDTNISP